MEVTAAASTTGSKTIADLVPCAAAEHAQKTAVRYKRDGDWHDVTYAAARGHRAGDRPRADRSSASSPANAYASSPTPAPSGPTSTWAPTSTGAVVVPIYPTNSPEECLWVISDSEASAIVCENEEQLAKIAAIREQVPHLRTIIMIDPVDGEDPQANGSAPGAIAAPTIATG